MNSWIDTDKIKKKYNYYLNIANENNVEFQIGNNYYKAYLISKMFNYDNFLKYINKQSKSICFIEYPGYDIHNDKVLKTYLFGDKSSNFDFRTDKLKTIIAMNIWYSKILSKNEKISFFKNEYEKIFKDYYHNYIEDKDYKIDIVEMKLHHFDKVYNDAFKTNNDKHRRSQKCKLKNEYKKYLLTNNISECNLKEQLYLIITMIDYHIRLSHAS